MFEFIRLERTMCYGICPVYTVVVDNNGSINYSGEMYVYKSGEHQWKISKKKVEQLNDLIDSFDFKFSNMSQGVDSLLTSLLV